jgi:hypothetical protein
VIVDHDNSALGEGVGQESKAFAKPLVDPLRFRIQGAEDDRRRTSRRVQRQKGRVVKIESQDNLWWRIA